MGSLYYRSASAMRDYGTWVDREYYRIRWTKIVRYSAAAKADFSDRQDSFELQPKFSPQHYRVIRNLVPYRRVNDFANIICQIMEGMRPRHAENELFQDEIDAFFEAFPEMDCQREWNPKNIRNASIPRATGIGGSTAFLIGLVCMIFCPPLVIVVIVSYISHLKHRRQEYKWVKQKAKEKDY